MTVIQKLDNPDISIILDNIVEITKGDTIYTCVDSYKGFSCLNFRDINQHLIQWTYGINGDDAGKILRDKQYQEIITLK